VSDTLNDLAQNVDLELHPAQPILTASSSADGKEVLATVTPNPYDGQINFLLCTTGNAKFASIDVKPGDVVRYYVNADQESAERGLEQRTALQLKVRRLDSKDPESALIIENGLNGPSATPARIEIWRYSDKRMDAIRSALTRYVALRRPPAGWEPAPDVAALQQIVERANQWVRSQPPADKKWQAEPMIADVPNDLRSAKGVAEAIAPENLRQGNFADWEGRLLAQAVWCRDIAQWARGSATSDADVAAALFDWTVRNVQLDRPGQEVTIHHPWQALMYGHGSAAHRAWVFVELCRQQRIDAVVLRPAGVDPATAPLFVGVLAGDQVHLFDPQLGLPLPGKEGAVGTLAELMADDAAIRQLDLEGQYTYPATAEQLKQLEAFIVASPLQLARRSELLENALEGEDFVKLTASPKALAQRLAKHPEFKSLKLWSQPFQAIADEWSLPQIEADPEKRIPAQPYRQMAVAEFAPFAETPLLWKARLLHFQGNKDVRAAERGDPLAEDRPGHQQAVKMYLDPSIRPSNATLAKQETDKRLVGAAGKADASYWLGLLSYDRGNYEVALTWFGDRTLEVDENGRWADGARYNLARTHEALGHFEEAVKLLESDPKDAPQRAGNLLRARRLAEKAAAAKTAGTP
jgi:tetratricopeptide (TPR) repeat protein